MDIAETVGRVERHSPPEINEQIRRDIECSLVHFAASPERIADRLDELDQEWDIERTLEAQAAGAVLTSLVLSVVRGRRWLGLAAFSGYFLLQHALQGWCPPVSLYRRLGVRTSHEINIERTALKMLRGDFEMPSDSRDPVARARAALHAASSETSGRRTHRGLGNDDDVLLQESESVLSIGDPGRRAAGAPRTRPDSRTSGSTHPGCIDGV